jgi:hypothetical protein
MKSILYESRIIPILALCMLSAGVLCAGTGSDVASTDPLRHPVIAYGEQQVQTGRKDIQDDEARLIETQASMKEQKAFVIKDKSQYETALGHYGSGHAVTKLAKAHYDQSETHLNTSERMHRKALQAKQNDQRELEHAQQELQEDRNELETAQLAKGD